MSDEKRVWSETTGLILVGISSLLFGLWLGGGFKADTRPAGPKYSMVQLGPGAVAVMENSSGIVKFYALNGDKMVEILDPDLAALTAGLREKK